MTMNYNANLNHQTGGEDWIDLSKEPPSYNEVVQMIAKWATETGHTETRVPQPTDPYYQTRMREAYTSVRNDIAIIAADPRERDVRTRLVYLHNQASPYEELVQVRGQELNLLKGPTHVRAGWPAIVAGRYQQLYNLEQGGPHQSEWGRSATRHASEGGASEIRQVNRTSKTEETGNPVPARMFDRNTWAEMQDTRRYLAWRLTRQPQGRLSCNEDTLNTQLHEYARFA